MCVLTFIFFVVGSRLFDCLPGRTKWTNDFFFIQKDERFFFSAERELGFCKTLMFFAVAIGAAIASVAQGGGATTTHFELPLSNGWEKLAALDLASEPVHFVLSVKQQKLELVYSRYSCN